MTQTDYTKLILNIEDKNILSCGILQKLSYVFNNLFNNIY